MPLRITHFLLDWRLSVKECISNIGILSVTVGRSVAVAVGVIDRGQVTHFFSSFLFSVHFGVGHMSRDSVSTLLY